MADRLLFFDVDYVGDDLVFGYYLYDSEMRLLGNGETKSPKEIVALLNDNLPITYDLNYVYRYVLSFYEDAGTLPDMDKPFLCLYEFYRYKRHIHFYVDIVECLSYMGKAEEEIFPYDDSLGPKDRARLNRMAYEEIGRKYGYGKPIAENPIAISSLAKVAHIDDGLAKRDELIREAMPKVLEKEYKKYVFFDIECANTDFEEGKICEFSYVVYGTDWKLIEKREILMNPGPGEENDFKLIGRPDSSDLHLKYEQNDYEAYRQSPEFIVYANEIKALLEDGDTLLFGYEVESDLRFLRYSFKRYGIEMGNVFAVDVKRVYQQYLQKSMRSLGDLVERFVPKSERESLQFHAAIDDATATGLVLKYFLLMNDMDLKELLSKVSDDVLCELITSFYPTPDLANPSYYERLKADGLI